MNVYRSFDEIPYNKNTILTVGTFDGLHRGHQQILNRLLELSARDNLRDLVITFHPHPQIILQKPGVKPVQLLSTIDERLFLLREHGINNVLVVPFSYEFSQTDPEVFIREYLHKATGLKKILIGYDHLFGKDREGDINLLLKLKSELDFELERIEALANGMIIVSSTKIRNAISEANIETASEMLGHDYLVCGKVVEGDKRGSKLGIPTANINIENRHKLMPGNGVYIVYSYINGKKYFGMCNLGYRPTFTDDILPVMEVHFLDLNMDLYGKHLNVYFWKYIRHERKFAGKEEFLAQLDKDKKRTEELIEKFSK